MAGFFLCGLWDGRRAIAIGDRKDKQSNLPRSLQPHQNS
jgi:hypothetical protein